MVHDLDIDLSRFGKLIHGKVGKRTVELVDISTVISGGIDSVVHFPRTCESIKLLYRVNPTFAKRMLSEKTWSWKGFDGALVGLAFPGPHVVYSLPRIRRLIALNQEVSTDELEDSLEESLDWIVDNNLTVDVPEFYCPVYLDE